MFHSRFLIGSPFSTGEICKYSSRVGEPSSVPLCLCQYMLSRPKIFLNESLRKKDEGFFGSFYDLGVFLFRYGIVLREYRRGRSPSRQFLCS